MTKRVIYLWTYSFLVNCQILVITFKNDQLFYRRISSFSHTKRKFMTRILTKHLSQKRNEIKIQKKTHTYKTSHFLSSHFFSLGKDTFLKQNKLF